MVIGEETWESFLILLGHLARIQGDFGFALVLHESANVGQRPLMRSSILRRWPGSSPLKRRLPACGSLRCCVEHTECGGPAYGRIWTCRLLKASGVLRHGMAHGSLGEMVKSRSRAILILSWLSPISSPRISQRGTGRDRRSARWGRLCSVLPRRAGWGYDASHPLGDGAGGGLHH